MSETYTYLNPPRAFVATVTGEHICIAVSEMLEHGVSISPVVVALRETFTVPQQNALIPFCPVTTEAHHKGYSGCHLMIWTAGGDCGRHCLGVCRCTARCYDWDSEGECVTYAAYELVREIQSGIHGDESVRSLTGADKPDYKYSITLTRVPNKLAGEVAINA